MLIKPQTDEEFARELAENAKYQEQFYQTIKDQLAPLYNYRNVRIQLPQGHYDFRGSIQTIINKPVQTVQIITSKANTIRADHFHKKDSHYIYLISGKFEYYYRQDEESKIYLTTITENQLIYTPPIERHSLLFLEDSVFLNITTGERDQKTYEDDIVKIPSLVYLYDKQ